MNRCTTRWHGKSRNHRRRDIFQFPFNQKTMRREAIVLQLTPWFISEYRKASDALNSKKVKPLKQKRNVLPFDSTTPDYLASKCPTWLVWFYRRRYLEFVCYPLPIPDIFSFIQSYDINLQQLAIECEYPSKVFAIHGGYNDPADSVLLSLHRYAS
jgi:hypothetical protein